MAWLDRAATDRPGEPPKPPPEKAPEAPKPPPQELPPAQTPVHVPEIEPLHDEPPPRVDG